MVLNGAFSSPCLLTTSRFDRTHGVRTLLSFNRPIFIDEGEKVRAIEMYGVPYSLELWCLKRSLRRPNNKYCVVYRTVIQPNECFHFPVGTYDAFLELPLQHPFVHVDSVCAVELSNL